MVQPILPLHSYEDYLERLEQSQIRLEFVDGIIYAMAGGTPRHNKLCARLAAQVGSQLGTGCEAYSPDQRIRARGASMFPDLSIVCGPEELAPDDANAIVNPVVVFEVLSPSTAATDQTTKADRYKSLPSLRHFVLVWQDAARVQVHTRAASGWSVTDYAQGQHAQLAECQLTLDVALLYQGLD